MFALFMINCSMRTHNLKMLGCLNPNLGQIWTNPNVGLKMQLKKCTVESKS